MMGLTKEDCMNLPPSDTPRVLFGHGIPELDWIDFDNKAGGRLATEHLIHLGHQKIGFVYFYTPEDFIAEREQGYRDAMNAVGLPVMESNSEGAYENTVEQGFNAGIRLLERADVSAVVCCSDQLASGVSQAAQSLGKQVPRDLSVVGFDGAGYERTGYPVLTTIKQPVFEIGKQLATHLLAMIDGKTSDQAEHQWFPPELIVNDSTTAYSQ
jgi:DNA-binding LacI/PurR family transcriptional regulator